MAYCDKTENFDFENNEIFGDDSCKIKTLTFSLNKTVTDLILCDYSDKQLLILTQFQKFGTLISVVKTNVGSDCGIADVYNVKTISGLDSQEYYIAARYLAQQLNIFKPILFSISLKDHSIKTLKSIVTLLKDSHFF